MKEINRKIVVKFMLSALFICVTTFISNGSTLQTFSKEVSTETGATHNHFTNFSVSFTDCVESIGVGLVPTTNAQELVPSEFVLVGTGQPVTPLVVRTSRCSISVNGHNPKVGEIVQIGAVIVPPDFTGDINNYTMFYYTSDLRLALHLNLAGVSAQFVPTIGYSKGNDDSFLVLVSLPGFPRFRVSGTVIPSPNPAGSFVANWWQKTHHGNVKMNTNVPVINIGGANLTLTTNANNPLGQLIGGNALDFPIIQQFNTFASAQMNVIRFIP